MTAADIGTTITNTATENQTTCNPYPVEPQTATLYVNKAPLDVNKTTLQDTYNVGDTVTYNIDVVNNGPDNATNVVVTDTLPEGLAYVSSTNGGVWDPATRTITWTVGNLAPEAHFTATVVATVLAPGGITLTNTAQATNDQMTKPVTTTLNIYIQAAALELTKSVNKTNPL